MSEKNYTTDFGYSNISEIFDETFPTISGIVKDYSEYKDRRNQSDEVLNGYIPLSDRNREWPFRTSNGSVNLNNIAVNFELFFNELCPDPKEREYIVVTAGTDGTHAKNSKHYKGLALDCTFRGHGDLIYKKAISRPDLLKKYNLRILGADHGTAPHLHIEVNTDEPVGYVNYTVPSDRVGYLDTNIYYGNREEDPLIYMPVSKVWPDDATKSKTPNNAMSNPYNPYVSSGCNGGGGCCTGSNSRSQTIFNDPLSYDELKASKDLSNREQLISFIRPDSQTPQCKPPKIIPVETACRKLDKIVIDRID